MDTKISEYISKNIFINFIPIYLSHVLISLSGDYVVPVASLKTPRKRKLFIRDYDQETIQDLKKRIIKNPLGFTTKIPVFARGISKDEFSLDLLPTLTLETLGGNHLRKASQELIRHPKYANCEYIKNRGVSVYVGLSDDDAEALAIQHQMDQGCSHPLSFMEKVRIIRRDWAESQGIEETEIGGNEGNVSTEFKIKMCQLLGEQFNRENPKVNITLR